MYMADQARLIYFFESALTPNVFWVGLKNSDFSAETGKVMKLDLGKDLCNTYSGSAVKDFKAAKPSRLWAFRVEPGASSCLNSKHSSRESNFLRSIFLFVRGNPAARPRSGGANGAAGRILFLQSFARSAVAAHCAGGVHWV